MTNPSPDLLEQVKAYLRENLRIEVQTTSEYTGGMDGSGSLYSDCHTLRLTLDGETISEIQL